MDHELDSECDFYGKNVSNKKWKPCTPQYDEE